ncbi:hypothetical protein EDD18DRAFT_1105763 [Armillaria luteobubalina]|uniref:Uncharacterized protein n=1 Tax=Armillaria luteobubalina TaxID=153913 RepID=A0AA39Q6J5_9AGAR|nr:hypothetical protein EDD18DRAFT_1105763 [Armillaria luteobubalina]
MVKAPSSPASKMLLTAGDATRPAQSLVHEASASMRILINNGGVQIRGPYIDGPITGVFNIKNDYVLRLSRLLRRLTIAALTAGDATWLVQSLVHEASASMRILINNGGVQIRGPYIDGPITGAFDRIASVRRRSFCRGFDKAVMGVGTQYGIGFRPRGGVFPMWKGTYRLQCQTIAVRGDLGMGVDCGGVGLQRVVRVEGMQEWCARREWRRVRGREGHRRERAIISMDGQTGSRGMDGRVAVKEGQGGGRSLVAEVYRDGLLPA